MKKLLFASLGISAALLAPLAAAQVTFYEQEGFRGRTFTTNGPINNLDHSGFNDRASSAIVDRGNWQVCENSDFRGQCIVLRPGQYPSLGTMGMNNRISSIRRVRRRTELLHMRRRRRSSRRRIRITRTTASACTPPTSSRSAR